MKYEIVKIIVSYYIIYTNQFERPGIQTTIQGKGEGGRGGLKTVLKGNCEGVHLQVKLPTRSLETCKFTENGLLHRFFKYFS